MNYKVDVNTKTVLIYLLLILSLAPISITSSSGEGISANYLFILIIPFLIGFRFKANAEALLFICTFSACFFLSLPVNYLYSGLSFDHFVRQSTSFFIFLGPFVLLFASLKQIEHFFVQSIIIVSFIYSIFAIAFFVFHAANFGINPFVVKDALSDVVPDWPQRYVLVLFAGFFFSFDLKFKLAINYFLRFIILFAIMITFLRAAFLALFIGFLAQWLCGFANKNYKLNINRVSYLALLFIIILVFINNKNIDNELFESYSTIVKYFFDSAASLLGGEGADSVSDQTRLDILSGGLRLINPFFGLGGGGIYFVIPEIGSAHNQFFDYYVRFGILGLFAFIYFNYRVIKYFRKTRPCVVGLILTYVVYGAAHETTKYSYGALIFFFLVSLTYNIENRKKIQVNKDCPS